MKASFRVFAANTISLWIGFPSRIPVLAFGLSINLEQWFAMTVSALETPGRMLFRPPENPAKKCGSIKPSEIRRSASAAIRLTFKIPPDGRTPISFISSLLWLLCTTKRISSRSRYSSPNLSASSSLVVSLWKPVAIRTVNFAFGLPSLISFNISGKITLLGTGLVWSLAIRMMLSFPFASSLRRGDPIGCSIASLTISRSCFSAWYPCAPETRIPRSRSSGIQTVLFSLPYGSVMFAIFPSSLT